MRSAKPPRLHHALTWHELDLAARYATAEQREGIPFAVGDLGWLPGRGAEQAATGKQLEDLLRRRGDLRFLMDGLWSRPGVVLARGFARAEPAFAYAASAVRGAAEWATAADFQIVAQADDVVVPTARTDVDALELFVQTVVVEGQLAGGGIESRDREGGLRP